MVPGITAVRTKGILVYQPLKEGYRAWAAGFALRLRQGISGDLAYEFINWFSQMGGRPFEPAGLLSSHQQPGKHGSLRVGLLDARQPAAKDIMSPTDRSSRRPVRFVTVSYEDRTVSLLERGDG